MKRLLSIVLMPLLLSCFNQPIKIGYIGGQKGLMSELGVSGRNGVELAVNQINAKGGIRGRKLILIVKDDENSPESGLKAVEELYAEKVRLIIGPMSSQPSLLAYEFINTKKMLMISPTISLNQYSEQDDFFFRIMPSNKNEAEALADYAVNRGHKKFCAVYEEKNKAYTENIYLSFKDKLEKQQGTILSADSYPAGDYQKLDEILKRISGKKPDALLSITSSTDNAVVCQVLDKMKNPVPVYASMWSMFDNLIQNGGQSTTRMTIGTIFNKKLTTPAYEEFTRQYQETYSVQPKFGAVFAYDAATILFQSIENARSADPVKVKKAILKKSVFDCLQEKIALDPYGDTVRSWHIFTVENGDFKLLDSK